jgi:hypothetical protein
MSGEIQSTESKLVSSGNQRTEVGKMLVLARRMLRRGPESLQADDTVIWSHLMNLAGVDPSEVVPALMEYMKGNEWFPAPCQIIQHVEMNREKAKREIRRQQIEAERIESERRAEAERIRVASLTDAERQAEHEAMLARRAERTRQRRILRGDPTSIAGGPPDDPHDANKREALRSTKDEIRRAMDAMKSGQQSE